MTARRARPMSAVRHECLCSSLKIRMMLGLAFSRAAESNGSNEMMAMRMGFIGGWVAWLSVFVHGFGGELEVKDIEKGGAFSGGMSGFSSVWMKFTELIDSLADGFEISMDHPIAVGEDAIAAEPHGAEGCHVHSLRAGGATRRVAGSSDPPKKIAEGAVNANADIGIGIDHGHPMLGGKMLDPRRTGRDVGNGDRIIRPWVCSLIGDHFGKRADEIDGG